MKTTINCTLVWGLLRETRQGSRGTSSRGRRWEGGGKVVRESLEVGDEEGRDSKLLVLPGEPQLVTAIPRQGVQVGEEDGLLHVLPEE